jgi:hypothetical protein
VSRAKQEIAGDLYQGRGSVAGAQPPAGFRAQAELGLAGPSSCRPDVRTRGDLGGQDLPAWEGEGQRSGEVGAAHRWPPLIGDREHDEPPAADIRAIEAVVIEDGFAEEDVTGRFTGGRLRRRKADGDIQQGIPG